MTQTDWEAEKAQAEFAEWKSDLARRHREAEHESAIAKATKDAADARRGQWTSLVSNLAEVPRGETKLSGDQPILGGALAMKGLRAAARKIADVVQNKAPQAKSILVTSDADLATSDAAYLTVHGCLDELLAASEKLLEPWPPVTEGMAAGLGAVAELIPTVLGMLSAQRTVSTFATSVDDLSAAANVIGALIDARPEINVVHDDFRMCPSGEIDKKLAVLTTKRLDLAKAAQAVVPEGYEAAGIVRKEQIKTLIAAVDEFTTSVRAVPTGSTRSALTNAMLYEGLRGGPIDHVLLVKGIAGSASQVTNDRPLWFKDKFSVVAVTNITYLLLKAGQENRMVYGGTASATMSVHGTIGDKLEEDPR